MHKTALLNAKAFFDTYAANSQGMIVVDIGAQDVNGSLRSVAPTQVKYIGVDFVAGKGVDVILDDPYQLPFDDNSVDIVLSSSCFEHSELFWLVYLEMLRILKPSGLLYLNVPSNGDYHRYPVDCWRFYPDSGNALISWAKRNHYNPLLLESYISNQYKGVFNDYVGVFIKDKNHEHLYPSRIIESKKDFYNGFNSKCKGIINGRRHPEDYNQFFHLIKKIKWFFNQWLK